MLGNSDFIMRQEQYQDLLREARQERLLRASGLKQPRRWRLPWYLSNLMGSKTGQLQPSAHLKRAAL
jgi:hypothetical protein